MNSYFQCFKAKLFQTQVSFERYLNSQSSQTPSTLSYNSILNFYCDICKTLKDKESDKKKTKTMTDNLIFHCYVFKLIQVLCLWLILYTEITCMSAPVRGDQNKRAYIHAV